MYYRQICNLIFPDYREGYATRRTRIDEESSTSAKPMLNAPWLSRRSLWFLNYRTRLTEIIFHGTSGSWSADKSMEMKILREIQMQSDQTVINTLYVNEREIYFSRYNQTNYVMLLNHLSSGGHTLEPRAYLTLLSEM